MWITIWKRLALERLHIKYGYYKPSEGYFSQIFFFSTKLKFII